MIKKLQFRNGSYTWHLRAYSVGQNAKKDNAYGGPPVKLYGQPTAESHPHLLKKGELTPGITPREYAARRNRLMDSIVNHASQMAAPRPRARTTHAVVVPSATKTYMTANIPYPFRQNSDFLYLTGFLEPDSVLVLKSDPSGKPCEAAVFVPKLDPKSELWDGPRAGAEGALALLQGVDEAHDADRLPGYLSSLFRDSEAIALWCDLEDGGGGGGPQPSVQRTLKAAMAASGPKYLNSHQPLLQQLRLVKSPAEVSLMSRSCSIASEAFVEVIGHTAPMTQEHHLYARMDCACRLRGADRLAYPPVVAGGERANVIHYVINNQVLGAGDLVLMDAGCEYGGYVSDSTRTWPVGAGGFSAAHRELYEALLEVQVALVDLCREGMSLDQLYGRMTGMLARALQEFGIVGKSMSATERFSAVNRICPHHVGHYLGMDVHDTPLIPRSRPLEPGMVITVEPGIYINQNDVSAPREFRGVGIRIEDNVLMTEEGPVVLSAKCPKTVADIEAIRRF